MIASNCPRCHEPFRIPEGRFPDDAYAECPWCRDMIPISEVIEKLPPVLVVLSADGSPLSIESPFVASAAGVALGGAEVRRPAVDPGMAETWAADQDFDDDEDDVYSDAERFVAVEDQEDEAWSAEAANEISLADASYDEGAAPMTVSPGRTRARKKGSPVRTLIGVALGPIIALPLAGIILLAFGRAPDLGFWPFDGSFTEAAYTRPVASQPSGMPRRVPTKSTGRSLANDLAPETSDGDTDPVADALSQISGTQKADDTLPDPNDDFSIGTNSDPSDARASIKMPEGEDPILSTPITPDPDRVVAEQPAPENVAPGLEMPDLLSEPESPLVAPAADDPSAPPSSVEVNSAIESNTADPSVVDATTEATTEATELLGQLIGFEGPDKARRPLLAKTYAAIAAVGAVAGDRDSNVESLVDEIMNSSLLDDLAAAAPQWLTYGKRTTDGILLVGVPGSNADGQTITLPTGGEVSLIGSTLLPNAKRVLALGRIVKSQSGQSVELIVAEPLQ